MKRLFFLISLFLLGSMGIASAQTGSIELLTAVFDAIALEDMPAANVPGLAIAVIHDGEIQTWVYGMADVEAGRELTADTPFEVASLSKAVTAWTIMSMVEDGLIDLDAPLNSYLDEIQIDTGRYRDEDVTVRRALSHTAGIAVDGFAAYRPDAAMPSRAALVERADVIMTPGQRFFYSGGGFMFLQYAIEDITGQSFEEVVSERVFEPLDLTDSAFTWSPELNAAVPYRSGQRVDAVVHADLAAGGLYASINDMAEFFAAAMPPEPGRGVITPESLAEIYTPVEGTRGEYGFGHYVTAETDDAPLFVWHDGIAVGSQTLFVLFPTEGEGILIFTNSGSGDRLYNDILCGWQDAIQIEVPLCRG